MSNKNILAVVLSIFSVFHAIGSENDSLQQPSGAEIATKIVKKGCLGGCAGLVLSSLNVHYSGRNFSKEDLPLLYASGLIGLGSGLACGTVEAFLDSKHRIYNSPLPNPTNESSNDLCSNKIDFRKFHPQQTAKTSYTLIYRIETE